MSRPDTAAGSVTSPATLLTAASLTSRGRVNVHVRVLHSWRMRKVGSSTGSVTETGGPDGAALALGAADPGALALSIGSADTSGGATPSITLAASGTPGRTTPEPLPASQPT